MCILERREKDEVLWKRRAKKMTGRTRREMTRPQGLVLSFYGHEKQKEKGGYILD